MKSAPNEGMGEGGIVREISSQLSAVAGEGVQGFGSGFLAQHSNTKCQGFNSDFGNRGHRLSLLKARTGDLIKARLNSAVL